MLSESESPDEGAPDAPPAGLRIRLWGFLIVVRPTAAVMAVGLLAVGFGLGELTGVLASATDVARAPLDALGWGAVFASCLCLTVIGHEAGHGIVGTLCGNPARWAVVRGVGAGVQLEGTPTGWRRVAISAAGPIAELGVAGLLVLVSPGGVTGVISSPTGIVGAAMAVNAVCGLLIPLSRNSDAAKIYRGLGQAFSRPSLRRNTRYTRRMCITPLHRIGRVSVSKNCDRALAPSALAFGQHPPPQRSDGSLLQVSRPEELVGGAGR